MKEDETSNKNISVYITNMMIDYIRFLVSMYNISMLINI